MAKPTKSKPTLTVPALIKWLRGQRVNRKYEYIDNCGCLIARFVKAQGFTDVSVIPCRVSVNNRDHKFSYELNEISSSLPHTYKAALRRAVASQSSVPR